MQLDLTGSTERRESPNTAPVLDDRASARIRGILMERLNELRQARGLTQVQAARWFGVSQSRISHLAQKRTNRFTVDTLINMLAHAGVRLSLTFETRQSDQHRERAEPSTRA